MTFVLTLWNHRLTDICVAADGIPEALRTRLGTTDRHIITAPGVHELGEAAKEGLHQDFCDFTDAKITPAKLWLRQVRQPGASDRILSRNNTTTAASAARGSQVRVN